jgi:hypothetical protein
MILKSKLIGIGLTFVELFFEGNLPRIARISTNYFNTDYTNFRRFIVIILMKSCHEKNELARIILNLYYKNLKALRLRSV